MASQNITVVPLVTTGGLAPYSYTIVNDSLTTLPLQPGNPSGAASVITSNPDQISIDATTVTPGTYSLHLHSTDSASATTSKVISIKILANTKFSILNESIAIIPTEFPYTGNLSLTYSGANGSVVWSLVDELTTIAGATITTVGPSSSLNFTLNQYGLFTIGLQAKDNFKTITKTINVNITPQSVFKLVNGQVEINFTDNGYVPGIHSFTLQTTDSATPPATVSRTYEFLLQPQVSPVNIPQSSVKYWYTSDTNSFYLPISGSVSGLAIQDSGGVFPNGVSYNVEGLANRVVFNGPPTIPENSELAIPINLQMGTTIVSSVAKTFSIDAYSGAADQSQFNQVCNAKPVLAGDNFSLNAQKPFFNSPSIERSRLWTARVYAGDALPTGLSLDTQTGLIYGKVLDNKVSTSRIQFLDQNNQVQGLVTINFTILTSDFSLIDESLTTASLSIPYTGLINTTTTADLASISLVSGTLPSGLTLSVSRNLAVGNLTFNSSLKTIARDSGSWKTDGISIGSSIVFSGLANTANNKTVTVTIVTDSTITVKETIADAVAISGIGSTSCSTKGVIQGSAAEAGHFDIWLKVTSVLGTVGYLYKRFEVAYVTPIQIITSSLPTLTNLTYNAPLAAIGGSGRYTWALDGSSPALPAGITLSSAGVLGGTYAGSSYPDTNIVIKVTDTTLPINQSATATFLLHFSSNLTITTASIPQVIQGQNYSYTLKAIGGSGTYTNWVVASGTLPTGLSLDSSTGVLSGVVDPSFPDSNVNVTISVTSSPFTTAKTFAVSVATALPTLTINTSGMGVIYKGGQYHGTLVANVGSSSAVGPFTWEVAPTSLHSLPTGLVLTPVSDPNPEAAGAVATVTGVCIQALSNYPVVFRVIDANGIAESATVFFSSVVSVAINTAQLDQGQNGSAYSDTLLGSGYNTPLVFSLDGSSPALPAGLTLTSAGLLSGTPTGGASTTNLVFKLTDSIGDSVTATLSLKITNSNLVLVTSAITAIPNGKAWSFPLVASGGAPGGYTWAVSPTSVDQLPNNVQLSASTGVLSTSGSIDLGVKNVTFRVTDTSGTVTEKDLAITVTLQQVVVAGPDYVNSTNLGYIGYIRTGNCGITNQIYPRTNSSFYAILTNFNSTTLGQVVVTTSDPNISAVPLYMNNGVVGISITVGVNGNLNLPLGDHTFTLNIVDNSSPFSVQLKYKVIAARNLTINQGSTNSYALLPINVLS